MIATTKPLRDLLASDLMSREVSVLSQGMPLRDAARLLLEAGVSGAPVVDATGRCVGVLSAGDFLRSAANPDAAPHSPLPVTCAFQAQGRLAGGERTTLCTLSAGACPIQGTGAGLSGEELVVCREPHCVPVDWQVVQLETLPTDEVARFMTTDPVTAEPDTPVRALARMMVNAHIHRVVIVNAEKKPVGIVSSTDLIAALAYCDDGSQVTAAGGADESDARQATGD
jgi:CBS domain-containing protein